MLKAGWLLLYVFTGADGSVQGHVQEAINPQGNRPFRQEEACVSFARAQEQRLREVLDQVTFEDVEVKCVPKHEQP